MSKPRAPSKAKPVADAEPLDENATELSLPIGARVLEILDVAYRARRPVLLEGTTGIGKSQIVGEFAAMNGINLIVLDLSLLEPPDLVGLPTIRDGRTHYASPAELPTIGRGVLMLEELNRAEIPVMQPALQLLSARRLHAYELPPGWICVAAVNPEDGDYQVNRLDPALRSRFLQVSVCADRESWLQWATRHNVHPVVLRVVSDHEDAFAQTSPRSWAYASEVLHVLSPEELQNRDLVRATLRGYLPPAWALLVTNAIAEYPVTPMLDADVLFATEGPEMLATLVKKLTQDKRLDAVTMVASRVRHALSRDAWAADALAGTVTLDQVEKLVASLPGDLRDQCLETAVESRAAAGLLKGLDIFPSRVIDGYDGSAARESVQEWRRKAQLHRVRLVVVGVLRWLRAQPESGAIAKDKKRSRQLEALIEDAGSLMAQDLDRWLRARVSSQSNATT
jgi:MoxR-like ATPase